MKLYDVAQSGNCYKVRLMLSLLDLPYETHPVNMKQGENKQPEFLRLNPRGQVPVFEDGPIRMWDSTAILVYLGRKYGGESWWPLDAAQMAQVTQWLAVAQNEVLYGIARARGIKRGRPGNLEEAQSMAQAALGFLERYLTGKAWLALGRPTIADVACYPNVVLAPEAGIALDGYPSVLNWIRQVESLPGYVTMSGQVVA
jgi:glutathione S-transferase